MQPKRKDLAVLLIHYHTPELLFSAIEALQAEFKFSELNAEIIIVDNGSEDSERQRIESLPATYLKSERNLGYAGGINRGAVFTAAEQMIFMNPDVRVQPGCLRALVDELKNGADAAGPQFFWDENLTYFLPPSEIRSRFRKFITSFATRGRLPQKIARSLWRRQATAFWNAKKPFRTFSLSGALLAVTRDAWNRVGTMDEGFQLYFEESDWLMRLKHAGGDARFVPNAHAFHAFNQSGRNEPQTGQWFAESQQRFEERYYGKRFCSLMERIARPLSPLNKDRAPETALIPELHLAAATMLPTRPQWFELGILPLGFPATGCKIEQGQAEDVWQVPAELHQQLSDGQWEVRAVDSCGFEALNTGFTKVSDSKMESHEQRRVSSLS